MQSIFKSVELLTKNLGFEGLKVDVLTNFMVKYNDLYLIESKSDGIYAGCNLKYFRWILQNIY